MIYKREEFIEENPADDKYPVKHIDQMTSLDGKEKKFIGRVSLAFQTPMGMSSLPVSFEIQTGSVTEAFTKFAQNADVEIEAAKRELHAEFEEMRRKSQSRIVTPGGGMPPDMSKIKLT